MAVPVEVEVLVALALVLALVGAVTVAGSSCSSSSSTIGEQQQQQKQQQQHKLWNRMRKVNSHDNHGNRKSDSNDIALRANAEINCKTRTHEPRKT